MFLVGITSKLTECICIGIDRMYLYWNVLGIFCLQEFVVWFSCNRSSCGLCNLCKEVYIFCCLCNLLYCTKPQNHKEKHTKSISCGHFNEIKLHAKLSIYA